jgi:HlyD family secretion protein
MAVCRFRLTGRSLRRNRGGLVCLLSTADGFLALAGGCRSAGSPARVSEVLVREGDIVDPGTVLLRFAAPELKARLEQQQARVAAAEANLLKANNGPRPEEIAQARSDLESNEADYENAIADFSRKDDLVKQKTLTRADLDLARAARDRFHGQVASSQSRLDLLLAGTRQEEKDLAAANLAEAKGRLRELQVDLTETRIISAERELIEVIGVRVGDLVSPNTPVIRVLRASDLWVRVYVPETMLGKVRLEQKAHVTIDSYPNHKFQGTVYQISNEAEFTPRNVQSLEERRYQVFGVKMKVDDPQGVFKAGMAAQVMFEIADPTASTPSSSEGPGS